MASATQRLLDMRRAEAMKELGYIALDRNSATMGIMSERARDSESFFFNKDGAAVFVQNGTTVWKKDKPKNPDDEIKEIASIGFTPIWKGYETSAEKVALVYLTAEMRGIDYELDSASISSWHEPERSFLIAPNGDGIFIETRRRSWRKKKTGGQKLNVDAEMTLLELASGVRPVWRGEQVPPKPKPSLRRRAEVGQLA
ncbi:MAG: hypothetical protein PHV42_03970 [Candidatus Pacebacteria bacterium]|nr:hypothetical protein [Candidatus Paceibacterota bacterium]